MLLIRRFTAYVCLLITIPIAAGAQEAPDLQRLPSVDLPAELDRVLREYETAWAAGDAEGLAGLFTHDGLVRSPDGWIRGHEAIRAKYENAGGPLHLRAIAYSVEDVSGYIVGAYGYGEESPVEDRGVFVLALRRTDADGPWLIAADLDNSINR